MKNYGSYVLKIAINGLHEMERSIKLVTILKVLKKFTIRSKIKEKERENNKRKVILLVVLTYKTDDEQRELNELLNQKLDWGYIGGILIKHRLSG